MREAAGAAVLRERAGTALLLLPALLVLAAAFVIPLLLLLSRSLFDPGFTLQHYAKLWTVPAYLDVLVYSFEIAAISTALTLLLGYPYACAITLATPFWRAVLISIVLLPFWTNILVRCYSWMLILQTKGVLNTLLVDWLGLAERPLALVYNPIGVLVGMVHYLLPPMVLILYSVMKAIDLRLVRAGEGLGATPLRAFWRIFVPLSLPGVRAGLVLIFILSLGFFVTPALLGGRRDITIAMLIDTQFTELLNWGFGAALAAVLLVTTLLGLFFYYAALGRAASMR